MPLRQSVRFRALEGALAVAERVVPEVLLPALDPAALIRAAGARPDAGAIQGLIMLLESLGESSELSMFGRLSLRWDFVRLLRNAERVEARFRADPALAAAQVPAPIFILGLPRSGTTFLHALMAKDECHLVPRNWQTIDPAPRPPGFAPERDRAARAVDRQLKFFAGIAPEFPAAHPIDADSPQECSEITAHVFQSPRFDTIFRVPAYHDWLTRHGHDAGFAFHKKFLQTLQAGLTGHWVLKCPDHVFAIDSILRTYPDARFVLVHRDPIKVFGSVAHLTEILRRPFLKTVDPAEIGTQVSDCWIDGAARLVAFDQRADIPAGRKIHLQYEALVANPLAAVARIYEHFGIPLSAPAEAGMREALAAKPRGGYSGSRLYALSRFGLNPERLGPRFAGYVDYFGITPRAAE